MTKRQPEFILSKSKVLEQYHAISQIADLVSYSLKTNQDVGQILEKNTECLFSVHMRNELKHITNMKRVIFLAQGWDAEEIESLIKDGITYFVVDNVVDLDVLTKFLENYPIKVNLLLRIKLREKSVKTERYFVFGMNLGEMQKKIREIRQNPLLKEKIGKLGIHFHKKTQNVSEWNLISEVGEQLDEDILKLIDVVNIGGGVPSEYKNTNRNVLEGIFKEITAFKEWLHQRNIEMIIEPGRYIAASPVKLVCNIIRIYENNIIVDASVYNSDMDAIIVPTKLLVEGELEPNQGKPYVIKGVTPCSMDIFRYRVYLNDPKVGDKVIFLNAGAYNFTSDFCDLEKIPTKIVD